MSDYIKEKIKEFEDKFGHAWDCGLGEDAVRGKCNCDYPQQEKWLTKSLQEMEERTREEERKSFAMQMEFSTRCNACDRNSSYLASKLSPSDKEGEKK